MNHIVKTWVESFNAYPVSVLHKVYKHYPDTVKDITPKIKGDYFKDPMGVSSGEIVDINDESFLVRTEDGLITHPTSDIPDSETVWFPMWNMLWHIDDQKAENWIMDNLRTVASMGFKIYEFQDVGILLGIDDCLYDFYENLWAPLYDAIYGDQYAI